MIVIKGTYRLRTLAIALALTSCAHAQSASAPAKIRDDSPVETERDISPAAALALANKLLAEGKSDQAAAEFERLAETWEKQPGLRQEADRARFNQACALAAMDQAESAAGLLRRLSQETEDLNLRGNARHNLGLAEAALSEAAMKEDLPKAIDLMRRAERDFRNAAADQRRTLGQADADTMKNIEVAQRKAAKMEAEQKKREDEQKQQEKQESQDKQKQDQQDEKKQEQQQSGEQQKQNSEEQQQKQQGEQGEQQPKPSGDSEQSAKEQEAPEGPGKPKEEANPQKEALSEEQQQELQEEQKTYDLTAMQILEKERQNRALIRQLLKRMRGKLAPVEKDW